MTKHSQCYRKARNIKIFPLKSETRQQCPLLNSISYCGTWSIDYKGKTSEGNK